MTFEVRFIISESLNFLGYARSFLERKSVSFLWSRDVEKIFACRTPLEKVLPEIPEHIREVINPYQDQYERDWPSFYEELGSFRQQLEKTWKANFTTVMDLMNDLGFFYSDPVEVFLVMPFFREGPRSNPLTMPAVPLTVREILEFLTHEILHVTTDTNIPGSLWHYMSMVFLMKKVPEKRRPIIQHALIYVAASWITSQVLKEGFKMLKYEKIDPEVEKLLDPITRVFLSSKKRDPLQLAEAVLECCTSVWIFSEKEESAPRDQGE